MKQIAWGVTAFLLTLCLAGCTSAQSGRTPPPSGPQAETSSQQTKALADGTITREEFMAGFAGYEACMEKAGYETKLLPQTDQSLSFSIPEAAIKNGKYERCYGYYWKQIDIEWQVLNEDTSDTAQAMQKCLSARGVSPKPHVGQMLKQLVSIGVSLDQCGGSK